MLVKTFFKKKYLWFYLVTIIVPFIVFTRPIIQGAVPFWNDPARDLLMAWDNLNKLTLIGPTSGIPGIFYGPQWIWILSGALIISKDPRWVIFLTATLPYFIIFSYLLYQLTKDLFTKKTATILWVFFIFVFGSYSNQLWSPNLAPLFFFCIVYIFYKIQYVLDAKNVKKFFLMAIFLGLLLNHLISFGVGVCFAFIVYFFITFILSLSNKSKRKISLVNWTINFSAFLIGFLIINSPFLLFELRHGFFQLKSLFFTLNQQVIQNTSVVDKVGLSKVEIFFKSTQRISELLSAPKDSTFLMVLFFLSILIVLFILKDKLYKEEKRILYFLGLNYFGIMFIYLTAKNPIWNYHFIGFEIFFLFLIGIIMKKIPVLEKMLFFWMTIVLVTNIYRFIKEFNNKLPPELLTKKENVQMIYNNAVGEKFGYFAKNAAIYTFDYDYMFRWVGKNYNYVPSPNTDQGVSTVYLIIPDEFRNDQVGFTENRTPATEYKTVKQWLGKDKTIIIRRERLD